MSQVIPSLSLTPQLSVKFTRYANFDHLFEFYHQIVMNTSLAIITSNQAATE